MTPEEAARQIGALPYAEVAQAVVIDHHRELRTGIPEIVYGASKTAEQIVAAMRELVKDGGAIATRVDAAKAAAVLARAARGRLPRGCARDRARQAGAAPAVRHDRGRVRGHAAISASPRRRRWSPSSSARRCCASATSASPGCTACSRGRRHPQAPMSSSAVAGMEAALPCVLGGLIDRPLIAVPTSVGYGVSLDGLVALGALLSGCVPGIDGRQHRQRRRRGGRGGEDRDGCADDAMNAASTSTSTARAARPAT